MTNKLADAPLKDAYVESDEEDLLDEGDEVEMGDVIHRPDGYYWVAVNGKQVQRRWSKLKERLVMMCGRS